MLSSSSSTMPSAPSRYGCWTMIASRHSVLAVNVVSQPVRLSDAPAVVEVHAPDRAARGVGDVERAVVVEREAVGHQVLGAERVRRLAPGLGDRDRPRRQPAHVAADAARDDVVGERLDAEDLLRRRRRARSATRGPAPVPPSVTQRSPRRSKATPLEPGTPVAKTVAVGGAVGVGPQDHDAAGVGDVEPPVRPEGQPGRVARAGQVADHARCAADPEDRARHDAAARARRGRRAGRRSALRCRPRRAA